MIKKLTKILLLSTVCSVSSLAGPILVGTWDFTGGGSAAEFNHATSAITSYNGINNPDLPSIVGMDSIVLQAGTSGYITGGNDKVVTWTAGDTYDFYYVLTKYGQAHASFDSALHYVLAGESLTYNPGGSLAPNGLSHVSIWGGRQEVQQVPDGGSTVAILGLASVILIMIRHKYSGRS